MEWVIALFWIVPEVFIMGICTLGAFSMFIISVVKNH